MSPFDELSEQNVHDFTVEFIGRLANRIYPKLASMIRSSPKVIQEKLICQLIVSRQQESTKANVYSSLMRFLRTPEDQSQMPIGMNYTKANEGVVYIMVHSSN